MDRLELLTGYAGLVDKISGMRARGCPEAVCDLLEELVDRELTYLKEDDDYDSSTEEKLEEPVSEVLGSQWAEPVDEYYHINGYNLPEGEIDEYTDYLLMSRGVGPHKIVGWVPRDGEFKPLLFFPKGNAFKAAVIEYFNSKEPNRHEDYDNPTDHFIRVMRARNSYDSLA